MNRLSGGLTSSSGRPGRVRERPLAHGAAPKSAARPIGPGAYSRDPCHEGLGDAWPERHLAEHVALEVDAGRDLDEHEAVVGEGEDRSVGDVADLLAALARQVAVERDLAHALHELGQPALADDAHTVIDVELEAAGGQRADEVDPTGRALMFGKPPGPRTRPSKAWTLTLPTASTSANDRLAMSSPPPS